MEIKGLKTVLNWFLVQHICHDDELNKHGLFWATEHMKILKIVSREGLDDEFHHISEAEKSSSDVVPYICFYFIHLVITVIRVAPLRTYFSDLLQIWEDFFGLFVGQWLEIRNMEGSHHWCSSLLIYRFFSLRTSGLPTSLGSCYICWSYTTAL